jgi:hypothetical protein
MPGKTRGWWEGTSKSGLIETEGAKVANKKPAH